MASLATNTTLTMASENNVICEQATLSGHITLGSNNIIHPKSTIMSLNDECGGILIGSNNIIEEYAMIINRYVLVVFYIWIAATKEWGSESDTNVERRNKETLIIGDNNLLGIRSVFEGVCIGSDCILEAKSKPCYLINFSSSILTTSKQTGRVQVGTSIGSNCIIGVNCSTGMNEIIPDHTILYGQGYTRTQTTTSTSLHSKHTNYLKDVLPKYHHLKSNV